MFSFFSSSDEPEVSGDVLPPQEPMLRVSIETNIFQSEVETKRPNNAEVCQNGSECSEVIKEDCDTPVQFSNPKEKECWDTYRRMSEKGIKISFDTLLRGMLTPTEYRLRRKQSLPTAVFADNC